MALLYAAALLKGLLHPLPQSMLGGSLPWLSAALVAVCVLTAGGHALTTSHPLYEIWICAAAGICLGSFGFSGRTGPVIVAGTLCAVAAGFVFWDDWSKSRPH